MLTARAVAGAAPASRCSRTSLVRGRARGRRTARARGREVAGGTSSARSSSGNVFSRSYRAARSRMRSSRSSGSRRGGVEGGRRLSIVPRAPPRQARWPEPDHGVSTVPRCADQAEMAMPTDSDADPAYATPTRRGAARCARPQLRRPRQQAHRLPDHAHDLRSNRHRRGVRPIRPRPSSAR